MSEHFDITGIGWPCLDFAVHIKSLPGTDEGRPVKEASWQGGGVIPTGLVSAARQGLTCRLIGTVGDDLVGRFVLEDLAQNRVCTDLVTVQKGRHTDVSVVLSEEATGGRNILYRHGDLVRLSAEETDLSVIASSDYLYLSGAGPLERKAAALARSLHVKVLMDAGMGTVADFEKILPFVDYFIASEPVYRASFGSSTSYEENLEKVRGMGPLCAVFTFGSRGSWGKDETMCVHVPAYSVPVADSTGAGDTFHGAFFYGLKHGMDLRETIQYASAASAVKCTASGGRAGIPDEQAVLRFMKDGTIDTERIQKRVQAYSWALDDFACGRFVLPW